MVSILNSVGADGDPLPRLHKGAIGVNDETKEANHDHGQCNDGQDESGQHKLGHAHQRHTQFLGLADLGVPLLPAKIGFLMDDLTVDGNATVAPERSVVISTYACIHGLMDPGLSKCDGDKGQ